MTDDKSMNVGSRCRNIVYQERYFKLCKKTAHVNLPEKHKAYKYDFEDIEHSVLEEIEIR